MKYNRTQLCELAGMPLASWKTMTRRLRDDRSDDDLREILYGGTFVDGDRVEKDVRAKYSANDVFNLALVAALSRGSGILESGLPFGQAAKIVANTAPGDMKILPGYFIGYATLDRPEDGGRRLFGTLADIANQLAGEAYTTIHLVEPDSVLRGVLRRADEAGIPFRFEA